MPKCLIFVTVATALWVSATGAMAQSSRANGHAMRANPSAVGLIAVPSLSALERPAAIVASAHVPGLAGTAPGLGNMNPGNGHNLAATAPGLGDVNPGNGNKKALGKAQALAAHTAAQSVEAQQRSSRTVPTCQ